MPRGNQQTRSAGPKFEMVNVEFSHKDQRACNEWLAQTEHPFDQVLIEVVDGGFKISVSFDTYHDCYVGSLTDKRSSKKVKDVYLLRHGDLTKLVGVISYFFVVILSQGETTYERETTALNW